MSPVITTGEPPARLSVRPILLMSLALAVLLVIVSWVFSAVGGPSFVDAVIIHNPTDHDLQVEVSPVGGDPILSLGVVPDQSSARFERVADQGDKWVVHFSSAGADAGSIELTRDELKARHWKIEVPPTTRPAG